MSKLIELGNKYAKESDWSDFALLKFCLCAMGILIGVNIPKEHKNMTTGISAGIFTTTYIILMMKVFAVIDKMRNEGKKETK